MFDVNNKFALDSVYPIDTKGFIMKKATLIIVAAATLSAGTANPEAKETASPRTTC